MSAIQVADIIRHFSSLTYPKLSRAAFYQKKKVSQNISLNFHSLQIRQQQEKCWASRRKKKIECGGKFTLQYFVCKKEKNLKKYLFSEFLRHFSQIASIVQMFGSRKKKNLLCFFSFVKLNNFFSVFVKSCWDIDNCLNRFFNHPGDNLKIYLSSWHFKIWEKTCVK